MPGKTLAAIFGNFRLKLWALLISVGIWFYASSQVTEEETVRASLTITPPPGYALLYESDKAVRMTVAGPRALLNRLRNELAQSQFQLSCRLTDQEAAAGWSTLRVRPDWLKPNIPEEEYVQLSLRNVTPTEVTVFADPVRERVLPVDVRASVHLSPGFRLVEAPTCTPAQAKVKGPAMVVDALTRVQSNELSLYDVQENVHRPLALQNEAEAQLSNGTTVTVPLAVDPPTVLASILVTGEEERDQAFEGVPVLLMMPPGFPYTPALAQEESKVTVVVRAAPANLARLDTGAVKAYVDLADLAREKIEPGASAPYKEKVQVALPSEVIYTAAQAQPDRVTILLKNPGG
jgi:hypothetical protein